jgi:hypothetical protein
MGIQVNAPYWHRKSGRWDACSPDESNSKQSSSSTADFEYSVRMKQKEKILF